MMKHSARPIVGLQEKLIVLMIHWKSYPLGHWDDEAQCQAHSRSSRKVNCFDLSGV